MESDSAESTALSLSLDPFRSDSREPRRKAPLPPPPVALRRAPPNNQPPTRPRAIRPAIDRLDVLFPPVGSQWNNSPLAREARGNRPTPPLRRRRPWSPVAERFAYFPVPGPGYGRRRRVRNPPPSPACDSDPSTEESGGDATATTPTSPSLYLQGPDEA